MRIDEKYKLDHITVTCGSFAVATATVQMEVNGVIVRTEELGDGPVDSVFKAIKKLTKSKAKLTQYNVGSITGGTDAQGEVTVRVSRSVESLTIRAKVDGGPFRLGRVAPVSGRTVTAGPFLCAPTRAGFTATFLSWDLVPADASLH